MSGDIPIHEQYQPTTLQMVVDIHFQGAIRRENLPKKCDQWTGRSADIP